MDGLSLIAQAAMTEFAPAMFSANLGVAGLMLYWFAIRMEKIHETTRVENGQRLVALEKSVDRQAKAQLLALVSLGQLDMTVKDQAQQLLDEINNKGTGA
jgi:hypothetical protein